MTHPISRTRALAVAVSLGTIAASCSPSQPSLVGVPTFTVEQFQSLDWLDGTWIGTGGRAPFYETYQSGSDTLRWILHHPDSTASAVSDTGSVYLANGVIYHRSGNGRWTASALSDSLISFVPFENVDNEFDWILQPDGSWVAHLRFADGSEFTYHLKRLPTGTG